jgi:hypothetical protein
MDKVKASVIAGIIGLAVLFLLFIIAFVEVYADSERWEVNLSATSAISFSVAFTLGATAMILYKEKRRVYFIALSTIIEIIGFVPSFVYFVKWGGTPSQALPLTLITLVMVLPMLISTILFASPIRQQKGSG